MIRQVRAVLGVALFVAIIGSPAPASALSAFHQGWTLAATAAAIAALASLALRTESPQAKRSCAQRQGQHPIAANPHNTATAAP